MTRFELPDLGEGLQEAEIVQWHVSPGDHVVRDQPVVSVETDKAVVEIPAPHSGTIVDLLAKVGEVLQIGSPIFDIQSKKSDDAGAIVGDLADAQPASKLQPAKQPSARGPGVRATPSVRKIAAERGISLSEIEGSGPGGAILRSDLPEAPPVGLVGEELRGVRLAMAEAMAKSHASVVPATVTDTANIDAWNAQESPMVRLVHAVATAAAVEPGLNAWFDGKRLTNHSHLDLAIAVDTEYGLFAPVLRNASEGADIEQRVLGLRKRVMERTIAREDMKNGTFTLSNFGMLGGEFASLVITSPQVAILGAGRIAESCLAIKGEPMVRKVIPLSLTFDHRVVTGGEAARFMNAVRNDLEQATVEGESTS